MQRLDTSLVGERAIAGEGRKRPLTLKHYLAARHVQVSLGPEASDALDRFLADQGMERRVALRCQHYFAAAQVVAETGWLLTMPRTYARNLAQVLPVDIHELPFDLPPIPMMMYWHADREDDQGDGEQDRVGLNALELHRAIPPRDAEGRYIPPSIPTRERDGEQEEHRGDAKGAGARGAQRKPG